MRTWTRWQDWGNVVLGAWLFLSPWILAFTSSAAGAWNAWILGIAVAVVALWSLSAPTSRAAEWWEAALGAWTFVAPWLLGFHGAAAWNAWVVGFVVVILALWGGAGIHQPTPVHGGSQHV